MIKSATFLVLSILSSVEIILRQDVYLRLTLICSELVENQANASQTWNPAEMIVVLITSNVAMTVARKLNTETAMENVYQGITNVMEVVLQIDRHVARSTAFLQTPLRPTQQLTTGNAMEYVYP